MCKVMQIEVSYDIAAQNGTTIRHQSYLTAHVLRSLNLSQHGFADNEVDLSLKNLPLVEQPSVKPTVERA